MVEPLEKLARRAANEAFFLASVLRDYAQSEELDDAGLARVLGCRALDLPLLRLCRAPAHRSGGVSARHRVHGRPVRHRSAQAGRSGQAWPGRSPAV